jgi:hypothetical protein
MVLDSALADGEIGSDILAGVASDNHIHDPSLSRGKPGIVDAASRLKSRAKLMPRGFLMVRLATARHSPRRTWELPTLWRTK